MLASMIPILQKDLDKLNAYDMINERKNMFQHQPKIDQ